MKSLNVGLIGCGNHMREILWPSLRLQNSVNLTHVASKSMTSAQAFSQLTGIVNANVPYTDWSGNEVDAIVCSGPVDLHFQAAEFALRAGIPIFVEKPVVRTGSQLGDLLKLKSSSKSFVQVGYNLKFSSTIERFAQLSKELGNEELVIDYHANKPTSPFWNLPTLLESFLLAMAVHPLSLITSLRGAPVKINFKRVEASSSTVNLEIEFEHSSSASTLVRMSNLSPRFDFQMRIGTTTGYKLPNLGTILKVTGSQEILVHTESLLKTVNQSSGYVQQMTAFLTDVRSGFSSQTDLEDSIWIYQIFERLLSAQEKSGA